MNKNVQRLTGGRSKLPWDMPIFVDANKTGGMSIEMVGSIGSGGGAPWYPFATHGVPTNFAQGITLILRFDYLIEFSGIYAEANYNNGWTYAGGPFDIYSDIAKTNKLAYVGLGGAYSSTITTMLPNPVIARILVLHAPYQANWNIRYLRLYGKKVVG